MEIIYGLKQIRKYKNPVVALGVFDGLHIGHLRILRAAVEKARRIKGTSAAVTFFPHPQKEKSLYSLERRLKLISEIGIDVCVVVRFNKAFSRIPAENFIKSVLVDKIGARYVYVGRNFRFGRGAQGGCGLLGRLSRRYNFKLKPFNIIKINGQPVSSTYIRRLITEGELTKAEELLSRPVSVLGTVVRGSSLARRLGFPTANIDPHHEVLPPSGIYVVSAIFGNKKFKGVCYIARGKRRVEAHMFNFAKNIYGEFLEIRFIRKIREEIKFSSTASLIKQIKKDINLAKKISFSPNGSTLGTAPAIPQDEV